MFRIVTITLLFNLCCAVFYGQSAREEHSPKTLLIYHNEPGFLIPFIESELKNFVNINSKGIAQSYFNEINNFNNIKNKEQIGAELAELTFSQENLSELIKQSIKNKDSKNKVGKMITQYDLFLQIKTNTLGELIEFQLKLFDSKENVEVGISGQLIAVENFFINPKTANYLSTIKNSLYRLFEGSNSKPIPKLIINDKIVENNDTIITETNKAIFINGLNSIDGDTKNIKYIFRSIPGELETLQQFKELPFVENMASQEITIRREGTYKAEFYVFDGVNNSESIVFYIIADSQPQRLLVSDSVYLSVRERSFFDMSLRDKNSRVYLKNSDNDIDSVYISQTLIKPRLKDVDFSNITAEKIRFDSINRQYYFGLNSRFKNQEFVEKVSHYVYTLDRENGIFSEPVEITHEITTRTPISFYMEFGPAIVQSYGDSLNYRDTNEKIVSDVKISLNLGVMAHFTKNWKLAIDFNLLGFNNSESVSRDNRYIDFPGFIGINTFYLFNSDKISPFIGVELRTGSLRNVAIDDDQIRSKGVSLFGPKLGVHYNLTRNTFWDGDLRLNVSHLWLMDEQYNDIVNFNLNIGYVFSF